MAIDPRIPMMGEATPYESPFETQTNALALQQQRGAGQMADAKRALDMFKMGRQVLASSVDESTYQRGLAALRQAGIPTDDMPPNFDPEYVRSEGMALLDAEDRYKQQLFQQDNRLLSASPYTGDVDVIYEGPPKAPAAPAPMSDYQRRMLELREQELELRGRQPAKAAPVVKQSEGAKVNERERAKADAKYPQASSAYRTAVKDIDTLKADLLTLKQDPGLAGITGLISGRTPGILGESRRAEALFDKIMAKGQFRALQELRNASPTGGALGQITDKENAALRASFGALDRKQDTKDFIANIDKVLADLDFSRNNIEQAYNDTYSYREEGGAAPAAAPAAAPSAAAGGRATSRGTKYEIVED